MNGAPVVRRLRVDLETPFARLWNGGDAFRTAWFNALSMSFPVGEQFFIDAVREGAKLLPVAERERFEAELRGFVGQEATHRRIHALFNRQLEAQGHVNAWEARILRRLERLQGADPRHAVAITAATEHFTAILAEHLLAHPATLEGAEPRLRTLWLWHASEESEHLSTAFDLYRALGGDERWRRRWFGLVSWHFTTDLLRQTARNLAHDGALWRPTTWASAARFLFGRDGLVRRTFGPWRAYRSASFHPRQQGGMLGERWLRDNSRDYTAVG
ncbi:MAG TPA: metal-dependent hydrolase [Burkholderiaceae bacterium]